MMITQFFSRSWNLFNKTCELLAPLANVIARFSVAKVFFDSGLVKIQSWSDTLMLFDLVYHVPYLPPAVAASLSICVELGVSSLLIVGLGGRLPAFILFIFNIIAVISYPFLLTPQGTVGLTDHYNWGLILLLLLAYGNSALSIDALFMRWYKKS